MARYKKTTHVPRPHRQDLRQAQEAGVVTLPPPRIGNAHVAGCCGGWTAWRWSHEYASLPMIGVSVSSFGWSCQSCPGFLRPAYLLHAPLLPHRPWEPRPPVTEIFVQSACHHGSRYCCR